MYGKLFFLAAFAAQSYAQSQNLTAALTSTPSLSNLTSYVNLFPQLVASLSNATNITILAPSNDAFAAFLNTSSGSVLQNDQAAAQALLQYHVLQGTHPASSINGTPAFVHTLLNGTSYANVTGGQVVEAVTQGSSVEIYSGLLNNATVTTPNINFTGGVIHVINRVLTIPSNISYTAQQAGLSALVGALGSAQLVSAVDTTRDVTVFAPNNDAFRAIGSALGNLTTQQLTGILGYHVVNGTVGYSSSLKNGSTLTALNGGTLAVTIQNGNVFVNSAKVVTPNVLVANGVVHVIDGVLNPNATSAKPNPSASSQSVAFAGASAVSNLPLTSGVSAPTTSLGSGPSQAAQATSASAGSASSSSKSGGAAQPMKTGAVGVAALFAGAGVWLNA